MATQSCSKRILAFTTAGIFLFNILSRTQGFEFCDPSKRFGQRSCVPKLSFGLDVDGALLIADAMEGLGKMSGEVSKLAFENIGSLKLAAAEVKGLIPDDYFTSGRGKEILDQLQSTDVLEAVPQATGESIKKVAGAVNSYMTEGRGAEIVKELTESTPKVAVSIVKNTAKSASKIIEENVLPSVQDAIKVPDVSQWNYLQKDVDAVDLVTKYSTQTIKEAANALGSGVTASSQALGSQIASTADTLQDVGETTVKGLNKISTGYVEFLGKVKQGEVALPQVEIPELKVRPLEEVISSSEKWTYAEIQKPVEVPKADPIKFFYDPSQSQSLPKIISTNPASKWGYSADPQTSLNEGLEKVKKIATDLKPVVPSGSSVTEDSKKVISLLQKGATSAAASSGAAVSGAVTQFAGSVNDYWTQGRGAEVVQEITSGEPVAKASKQVLDQVSDVLNNQVLPSVSEATKSLGKVPEVAKWSYAPGADPVEILSTKTAQTLQKAVGAITSN